MSEVATLRKQVRELRDILEIQRVISGATLYCDLGDPNKSEALYTEDAALDYSAIFGPEASALTKKQHWANVRALVPGLDAAQHQNTNFDIDIHGDEATATSLVRGTLRVKNELAISGSIYIHQLIRTALGWRIRGQKYMVRYSEGMNMRDLLELARLRAKE